VPGASSDRLPCFSGVVNLLMALGLALMLQVYDRVIPSRSVATLIGSPSSSCSPICCRANFEALRARLLLRVGTLFDAGLQRSIYLALATLPLKGARRFLTQQPLRDLDQVRAFLSGIGPTAFLDMPWIPIFLIVLFLFHPVIGATALLGALAIIAVHPADRASIQRFRQVRDGKRPLTARSWPMPRARMPT